MSLLTLTGRTAVVTGSAQGIGFAIAKMMCENGMKVAIVDLNGEKAAASAAALCEAGGQAMSVACNVSDEKELEAMMAQVADHFGGIDVLVNAAGILGKHKNIAEMERGEWDAVLGVNLSGAFFGIQKALPYLEKSKAGRVINISSLAGRMGGFETAQCYTASKGGINSITYGIARQLAPKGITVNSVCPGTTATDIIKAWTPEAIKGLEARIPLGRLGQPEDIAAAVCFLASEEAGFITGVLLDVNGGMFMG